MLADAQRQEAEERYRRMSAKVEDLEAAIQAWQQRFNALDGEINKLRQELARVKESARDTTTQENIKRLADAIQQVDEKRQSDNEKVRASLAELKKSVLDSLAAAAKPKPAAAPTRAAAGNTNETIYEYTVRPNDSLSRIVTLLNKQGVKVTQKQIMEANPKIKWERLQIGKTILIPVAAQP